MACPRARRLMPPGKRSAGRYERRCRLSGTRVGTGRNNICASSGKWCSARVEDRFLFLADAVLGEQSRRAGIPQRSLPLTAETTAWMPPTESPRRLPGGAVAPGALVFPLALPEWRRSTLPGCGSSLRPTAGWNCARAATGSRPGHAFPLFLDLGSAAPGAAGNLAATDRRRNTPGGAGGFGRGLLPACRSGNKQWLVYRSLGEPQQPHRARPESRRRSFSWRASTPAA